MSPERDVQLSAALAAVMGHAPIRGADHVPGDDSVSIAVRGLCWLLGQQYAAAYEMALQARARARDAEGEWIARALLALAQANVPATTKNPPDALTEALESLPELGDLRDPALRTVATHLLLEAACSQYRIPDGLTIVDALGPPPAVFLVDADGHSHPYLELIEATYARTLVWAGRTDAALAHLSHIPPARSLAGQAILSACQAVAAGHAADAATIRGFAEFVEATHPDPRDHIATGLHLLAAYGLAAVGETARAARAVLTAGGDADLPRMNIIDRAMSLELLVAAALLDGDLDAAEAWAERLVPLETSRIARATVLRARARIAIERGELAEAHALTSESLAESSDAGRPVESADSSLLLSRIEIAQRRGGTAQERLDQLVRETEPHGHTATRLAANRELRRSGRRLPPPRGRGWDALSGREREVALLLAQGHNNADVAKLLHLSVHTVRVHVSRVLATYAVPSRTLLAGQLTRKDTGESTSPATPSALLTRRQQEVANLVADGARNVEIAARLGIRERTVEGHIAAIMQRWKVTTRAGIASRVVAADCGE